MRNQKEEFFELIYAQYAKKLERICLRYVNYQPEYREIAADSVQKTFLKALEEYDKLKDASYIEPWLYQTCMHRFTTALKTYRRRMLLRIEAYILQLLIIHPILLLVKLIILLPRLTLMDMKRFILHRL